MKTSEQTDKISLAYVAAWAELTNPPKDGKANYGRYTTLPALLDHVKGPLTANGIAVMQEDVTTELGVGCVTRLVHTSGQFYEFGPLLFPGGDTAQKGGSATTYARRYQLSAAVGVASDEDDDGAQAARPTSAGDAFDQARRRQSASEPARSETGDGGVAGEGHATAPDPEEGGPSEVETPASGDLATEVISLYGTESRVLRAARMLWEVTTFDALDEGQLQALREKKVGAPA